LNEFSRRYPLGPELLAKKIIQRFYDIRGNNKQLENVYQDLLNNFVGRFNQLKKYKLEIDEIRNLQHGEETKYHYDHSYFNDTKISKYSGLIDIQKDLLKNLKLSTMTKNVLDTVREVGESPKSKTFKTNMVDKNLSVFGLQEQIITSRRNSLAASQVSVDDSPLKEMDPMENSDHECMFPDDYYRTETVNT
jgi:hypothetical protein